MCSHGFSIVSGLYWISRYYKQNRTMQPSFDLDLLILFCKNYKEGDTVRASKSHLLKRRLSSTDNIHSRFSHERSIPDDTPDPWKDTLKWAKLNICHHLISLDQCKWFVCLNTVDHCGADTYWSLVDSLWWLLRRIDLYWEACLRVSAQSHVILVLFSQYYCML